MSDECPQCRDMKAHMEFARANADGLAAAFGTLINRLAETDDEFASLRRRVAEQDKALRFIETWSHPGAGQGERGLADCLRRCHRQAFAALEGEGDAEANDDGR